MSGKPVTLTVVCTANICRSPMAAGLLRHALEGEPNAPAFRVESTGLAAHNGEAVSENSLIAMKRVGIDISNHQSQLLTPEIFSASAAVFCMTSDHVHRIETLFPAATGHLRLFREFAASGSPEVPDPYGGSIDEYIQCRDSLLDAIPGLLRFLFQEVFPARNGETR